MYVNPFWFGVAFTLGTECFLLILVAIYMASKK